MNHKQSIFIGNKVLWFVLIICGVAAQYYKLPTLFDNTIVFTAVFYLAIIRLFGFKQAMVATVLINLLSFFVLGEAIYVWLNLIVVLFIGGLYCWKGRNLFFWAVVLIVVYWPLHHLVVWFNQSSMEAVFSDLIFFQVCVAILTCALLADILADYLPRIPIVGQIIPNKEPIFFGRLITHLIVAVAVVPMLVLTVLNGWYEKEKVLIKFTEEIETVRERLEERIDSMDQFEIQGLQLGSVVQKAHIKEMFINLTNQSSVEIYALDEEHQIFISSDDTAMNYFTLLEDGYVNNVNAEISMWKPSGSRGLLMTDWLEGYYFTVLTLDSSNLQFFILMPLADELLLSANTIALYFKSILLLFILANGFAFMSKRILSKSLFHLTKVTSDLPKRMNSLEDFKWTGSQIYEFDALGQNFEQAAVKLKEMFLEAIERNNLLLEKTERLQVSEELLYRKAHYDELTQLPNRYAFQLNMDRLFVHSSTRHQVFAVAFIDLDKFKQVNDTIGHNGGDLLLQKVAKRLQGVIEGNKRVNAYRIGGDEFVVTIEDTFSREIEAYCQEILKIMREPISIFEESFTISASIGVSRYPVDGEDIETILNKADNAMYKTKESGKDNVTFTNR
ncbi:GGDEF domain-containing protein [Bacillus solitudinis]|uniref:GGDEF domain-containing protein n=1 Tax=Bacillus solitudinis TaxID=2014074 RepID=UPI000C24CC5F|nr:GGDEF domain-containing protein [Bacillus solitudinis]